MTAKPSSPRRPRILFMASQPFFEWRGSPIRLGFDASAMALNGYDVTFLTLPVGQRREIPGVRIVRPPNLLFVKRVPIGPSLPKFFFDGIFLLRAIGMQCLRRYDIVHGVEDAGFVALLAGRLFRRRVVFEKHSDPASYSGKKGPMRLVMRLYAAFERFVMRHADAVIGTGPGLVDQVRALAPKTPAFVISDIPSSLAEPDPEGVRTARARLEELAPGPKPETANREPQTANCKPQTANCELQTANCELRTANCELLFATYVGSFATYQGIDLLFDAIPRALRAAPALRFAIIGGTPAEIEARRSALAAEGLADRVAFVGKVPPDTLPNYLAASDILLSPRIAGVNTPLKLLDYLKVARAIVATDHPANRLILDDSTARLVPATPADFAAAIADLAGDSAARDALASQGRRLVDTRYNFDVFRRGLAEVHGSLLPQHLRP